MSMMAIPFGLLKEAYFVVRLDREIVCCFSFYTFSDFITYLMSLNHDFEYARSTLPLGFSHFVIVLHFANTL